MGKHWKWFNTMSLIPDENNWLFCCFMFLMKAKRKESQKIVAFFKKDKWVFRTLVFGKWSYESQHFWEKAESPLFQKTNTLVNDLLFKRGFDTSRKCKQNFKKCLELVILQTKQIFVFSYFCEWYLAECLHHHKIG